MDKRVLVGAGILVVAVVVLLVVKGRKQEQEKQATMVVKLEKPFPELQAKRPKGDPKWVHPAIKKIDHIEVTSNGKTVLMVRTKEGDGRRSFGEWEITKPFHYRADDYAVRQVIQRATSFRYWEIATKDPKARAGLHVGDKNGFRIRLLQGTRTIADFFLGKEVKAKLADRPVTYTYLRPAGDNRIWKILGSYKLITRRKPSDWRDPKVLHLKRDDIVALEIVTPEGSLSLKRNPKEKDARKKFKNWKIVSANPPIGKVEQNDLSSMASTLSYLRAKDFADGAKPNETGLDKPTHSLTVKTKDGKSYTLLFGKTVEKKVKRGKRTVKEKQVYVQVKGKPQVFLVQETRLRTLRKSPLELRDRTIIGVADGESVTRIEVMRDGAKVVLEKQNSTWKAVEPKDLVVDTKAVDRDAGMLKGRFKAKSYSKETDPKKTGLDKPKGWLRVTVEAATPKKAEKKGSKTATAKKRRVMELLVGKEAAKRERYVQVKGSHTVFIVRQYTLERLWKGRDKWKKRPRPRRPPHMPRFGR